MPTLFVHRLIVVCPASRYGTLGTWWKANMDPADDVSGWPKLNPSGLSTDAETHRWCSTALNEAQLRLIIVRVCNLAGVAVPTATQWNSWTRAEKRAWLASTRNQLYTNTGIWLDLSDGDGAWNEPESVLTALGLKRRQSATP